MERQGINQHGNQCPCFFGIPSPVSSPRNIRPHGTSEYSYSQQEDGWIQHDATYIGQSMEDGSATSHSVHDECRDTIEEQERKEGIGEHDQNDVYAEQW